MLSVIRLYTCIQRRRNYHQNPTNQLVAYNCRFLSVGGFVPILKAKEKLKQEKH